MATMPRVPARRPALPILALLAGLSPAMPAVTAASAPGQVTLYRCVGADGQLTLRDTPCAAGEHQEARGMLRPQDPPPQPPAAAPALPASSPVDPAPPRVVVVHAPTPTYECTTPDGDRYTSHDPAGNPRWVPLWTLGYPAYLPRNPLGDRVGAPRPTPPNDGPGAPDLPPIVGIAYTPGAWVRDRCVQLPRANACDILRAEQRELRKEWFDAMPTRRAEVAEEERALESRVARTCAG